jgi:hypothetical protein
MDNLSANLICRHEFGAQELIDAYPPRIYNANKKLVYRIACPPGCTHCGEIIFSRWHTMLLPRTFPANYPTKFKWQESYFGYGSPQNSNQVDYYLNFAHHDLFCAYGGALFAQDEMQVAEHPALGSLREALIHQGIKPRTVENGEPTPIIIRGVERRCIVATDPNSEQARPLGLYGNNFAVATPEAIQKATKQLHPPTITNIIAIEAPSNGYGSYTWEEIEYILVTAFTGFSAAKIEAQLSSPHPVNTVIHTGFWGCGAYGGNRVLMALLQLLAACLSQISGLVFHTGYSAGTQALVTARKIMRNLIPEDSHITCSALLEAIHAMQFQWGVSDGN